jgi:hypothetical protein
VWWIFHETLDGKIEATAKYNSFTTAAYYKQPNEQIAICDARLPSHASKLIAEKLKAEKSDCHQTLQP